MQCENCGQRPATVHMTKIINGKKSESHLCEVCARESGQFDWENNFSLQGLLSTLMNHEFTPAQVPVARAEPRCPSCGMTYQQFVDSGRLGCSQCYDHLEEQLGPLVRRIHGATAHTGKVPQRTGGLVKVRKELAMAKEELNRAVANEQFERAAELRDRIKALEQQIKGGDGNALA